MSSAVLAFDTSNYTTSAALFDANGPVSSRMLLPVGKGQKGLRQSDAVFFHTRQLPAVVEKLGAVGNITAVGCSTRPRDAEQSYMPCFTVGSAFARSYASLNGIPLHCFSHQQGHIAAALYSANRPDLLEKSFFAMHISGGTLEAVSVEPDSEKLLKTTPLAATLDLSAGQVIDRVGVMLGLDFPCGPQLEQLALKSEKHFKPRVCLKDGGVCLSGLENLCTKMYNDGNAPEDVARFCFDCIGAALAKLADSAAAGGCARVYCGGVVSNSIIRQYLACDNAVFCSAELSTDNAVGIAVLTAVSEGFSPWQ